MNQVRLQGKLIEGTEQLGLKLTPLQIKELLAYLDLLIKWNKVYSLTAIKDPDQLLRLHILDGLSIIPHFGNGLNILDVGSGMGVPAVILAIVLADSNITAIDSNSKKTSFLRQVAIELKLTNLKVISSRVELIKLEEKDKFTIITSRAFADLELFIELTEHLLAIDGKYLAMKSEQGLIEAEKITNWQSRVINLKVPFLEAQRFLIEMIRR